MIQEYGGLTLTALAIVGASGQIPIDYVHGIILGGAVLLVIANSLWSYLYARNLHMFYSAFFGAGYLFFALTYFHLYTVSNSLFAIAGGLFYLFTCIFTMKYTVGEIANAPVD